MRPLEKLPVWVVIRLCTDDEPTVSYWNSIDEKLELDIDVLVYILLVIIITKKNEKKELLSERMIFRARLLKCANIIHG